MHKLGSYLGQSHNGVKQGFSCIRERYITQNSLYNNSNPLKCFTDNLRFMYITDINRVELNH